MARDRAPSLAVACSERGVIYDCVCVCVGGWEEKRGSRGRVKGVVFRAGGPLRCSEKSVPAAWERRPSLLGLGGTKVGQRGSGRLERLLPPPLQLELSLQKLRRVCLSDAAALVGVPV